MGLWRVCVGIWIVFVHYAPAIPMLHTDSRYISSSKRTSPCSQADYLLGRRMALRIAHCAAARHVRSRSPIIEVAISQKRLVTGRLAQKLDALSSQAVS